MTPTQVNLHTRAMLVNLSISSWSARKFDKQITKETVAGTRRVRRRWTLE